MEYITGNKFKNFCHCSFDENGFCINKSFSDDETICIFIKVDLIDIFFQFFNLNRPIIIFTHNGDFCISENHIKYLNIPNVISWYAQNINISHPKLKSIPIGIANEQWPHGDISIFDSIINKNFEKNNLIYANFNIETNSLERNNCIGSLNREGINICPTKEFSEYLSDLSKSYFCISPNGNGIDCHKTWESLYLKTIPIVTKSINSLQYKDLPIIIIDDWNSFNINDFSIDLYNKLWYDFDINKLNFLNYISSLVKI